MNDDTSTDAPQEHWIGGQPTPPDSGQYMPVLNPADDSEIAQAAVGSPGDVHRAVENAHQTFQGFRRSLPQDRERWLCNAAELLERDADDFRDLLIREIGSPISKANREIYSATRFLRAAAGSVRHLTGKTFPTDAPGRMSIGTREPLGVIAGLTPFNVPLIKNVKHSAMALATGNTVVLLPSQESPSTAYRLAQLYQEAGFPDGAFNVVTGRGSDVGESLICHPRVRFVGFTGSSAVGKIVSRLCGEHCKRYTLEMGGKNALVVLEDADMTKAVHAAVVGSFFYQGQICMASRPRLYSGFRQGGLHACLRGCK